MPPRTRNQSRAVARATHHASGLDNGETAHPTAVESRVSLPADVLYLIVAQCRRDWGTLKRLRLTCKLLEAEATKYLFDDLYVTLYDDNMYRLVRLAEQQILAKSVKSLTIEDRPLLPELSFYRFCKYVELTDESNRADTRYMRGMYNSYKKDQEASKAYWRVCSKEEFEGYGPLYPAFEKAICNLPNLREIEILGIDDDDRPMWRDAYFDPNIEHEFDIRVHGAIEAAATAFVLRSIGLRNSSNSSLTRLTIEFPVKRWGPRDVHKAWESIARRREFDDDLSRATWVQKQMSLTRGAFTHLKTLRLETKMNQAARGNHCPVLGDWFASAPGLQCLELDMESSEKDDDADALRGILEHCQLPALQYLTLTIQDTTVDSLITLLSRVSDTLRSLRLCDCVFFKNTWPNFYERMRDIPFKQLCHLDFSRCADFNKDMPVKSHDEDMILAVKEYADEIRDSAPPETVIHESFMGRRKLLKGYSSDLYRYLLKEISVKPALYLYYLEDYIRGEDSSDEDSSTDDSSTDEDGSTDEDSSDDDSSVEEV